MMSTQVHVYLDFTYTNNLQQIPLYHNGLRVFGLITMILAMEQYLKYNYFKSQRMIFDFFVCEPTLIPKSLSFFFCMRWIPRYAKHILQQKETKERLHLPKGLFLT